MASSSNDNANTDNNNEDDGHVGDSLPDSNSLSKSSDSTSFARPFASAKEIKEDYSAIYFYVLQTQILIFLLLVIFMIRHLQSRIENIHANNHAEAGKCGRFDIN